MSDPLDDRFRDFATGTPAMNPATPSEIRRRGDRMRRRRTALAVAGTALAVALIATPVAVLAGGGSDDVRPAPPPGTVSDPPSDDPSPPAATVEIPPDIPLASGYPDANEDGSPVEVTSTPAVTSVEPCGRTAWTPPTDALDVAGASYLGPEDGRARTLVLYPSDDDAAAAVESLRDVVSDCSAEGDGPDGSAWREVDSPWEQDSSVVTRRYLTAGQPNTGLEVHQVVRVGNALLVDVNSGEGGATDESVVAFTDVVVDQAAPVVEAMAVFGGRPAEPTDPGSGSPPQLSASFLPAPGELPTRARLTPWEEVATTDEQLVGCQPDLGVGAVELIQRSYAARIAPVDGVPAGEDVAAEVRLSVLQYASAADAEAAEVAVTGWIRDCADPAGTELDRATRQGGLVETAAGAGTYGTWVYAARDVCTDCDAAWFERMGVLADQGRMVVVSFREVGGPLEPEGLDATMEDLMLGLAARSMPG